MSVPARARRNGAESHWVWWDAFRSPIGTVLLAVDEDGAVCSLSFEDGPLDVARLLLRRCGGGAPFACRRDLDGLVGRLGAYFSGDLTALDGITVRPQGTPFQREVWRALRKIRPGTTASYLDIARAIGRPEAARAVGRASALNPVALIVPCHRVIGADGSLTGYAGGVERKRWLLAHEGVAA